MYDHRFRFHPIRRSRGTENHVATASIKKPIHNVKEERNALHITSPWLANRFSSSLEYLMVRLCPVIGRPSLALGSFAGQCPPDIVLNRKTGGAYRDRTDDLMLAKQPLSQLS